jgi:hypothetical protein
VSLAGTATARPLPTIQIHVTTSDARLCRTPLPGSSARLAQRLLALHTASAARPGNKGCDALLLQGRLQVLMLLLVQLPLLHLACQLHIAQQWEVWKVEQRHRLRLLQPGLGCGRLQGLVVCRQLLCGHLGLTAARNTNSSMHGMVWTLGNCKHEAHPPCLPVAQCRQRSEHPGSTHAQNTTHSSARARRSPPPSAGTVSPC